ncbi:MULTISPECIES: DsbA family protein [unclassified Thalassospira]|uniref:DsbA family protein n=1 Tax=unclassified Thalassospira TaxID=2648997 RepID=UPI000A252D1D|nr:DsbA family protein [Thalassospira sp. MCCC 1A01428]OSQ45105.1 DSBA oxidoreductase [Thalassospira sp. MCCC 1A01428]
MLKPFKYLVAVVGVSLAALTAQGAHATEYKEHVMGAEDAPVTIVEYASFTCPHCARFANEVFPEVKKELIDTGKVKWIYRDYPLDGVAVRASAVAQCSGDDRYFGVLELLFKSQLTWARSNDPIEGIKQVARFAGMDGETVDKCLADEELINGIVGSRLEAEQKYNVNATPTFLIDGKTYSGEKDLKFFADKVDDLTN